MARQCGGCEGRRPTQVTLVHCLFQVARYLGVMNSPIQPDKFRAYRARKRAAGLREVRLWVPDTRSPEFRKEAARQAALLDQSDDEREASEMMRRLSEEARSDWQ